MTKNKLKQKIAEEVKELKIGIGGLVYQDLGDGLVEKIGITLEDVLIAFRKTLTLKASGHLDLRIQGLIEKWKPNQPLEKQSQQTKEFLEDILCD